MSDQIFVFDIETVPDAAVVKSLTGYDGDDVEKQRQELSNYHLEITNGRSDFPRQSFHKIVAISFLRATILRDGNYETYQLEELRSGGKASSEEKDLIKGFFNYAGKYLPRLISYNGRTFDIPVLKYRAMKYGINAEWFYKTGDKWANYNQRYAKEWHCDLFDVLSDYGASARHKMNEICASLDLPGKGDVDGSDVTKLYDRDKIQDIRDYCETDVANTFLLYLRYALHSGITDNDGYNHSVNLLQSHMEEQAENRQSYEKFLDLWRESSDGTFSAF